MLTVATACLAATSCIDAQSASSLEGGRLTLAEEIEAKKVVRLEQNGGLCTGVAVDEHWVLTALHCGTMGETPFYIQTGINRKAATIVGKPSIAAPSGDIALVFVENGLGLEHYADIAKELPSWGDRGINYGWGIGTGDTLKASHQKLTGTYTTGGYNNGKMFVGDNEDGAKNQPGDSGGPIFFNGVVAGITSSIGGSTATNFSSVPAVYEWIVTTVNSKPQVRSTTFMADIDPAALARLNQRIKAAEQQRNIANQNAREKAERTATEATTARQEAERLKVAAEEAKNTANERANAAERAADEATTAREEAERLKTATEEAKNAAKARAQTAEQNAREADAARKEAERLKTEAERAQSAAEAKAQSAEQRASQAEAAKTQAQQEAADAQTARDNAQRLANEANNARREAEKSQKEANQAQAAAEESLKAEQAARAELEKELAKEKQKRQAAEKKLQDSEKPDQGSTSPSWLVTIISVVVALVGGGIGGWLLTTLKSASLPFRF